jgi:hypothetical protein
MMSVEQAIMVKHQQVNLRELTSPVEEFGDALLRS